MGFLAMINCYSMGPRTSKESWGNAADFYTTNERFLHLYIYLHCSC